MNKSELMIGDWVILNYEGLKKPVCILRLHQHYADITTQNGSEINSVAYSLLEGIQLTEEILKTNGFEYDKATVACYIQYKDEWIKLIADIGSLEVGNRKYCGTIRAKIFIGRIKYIHELQNALRICKFTELADNFKLQ